MKCGPAAGLGALALAGCSVSLPQAPAPRAVPAGWSESSVPAAAQVPDAWWRGFGDPVLDWLVAMVPAGDDVALAEARLAEALARLGSARAALRPEVNAATAGSSQRVDAIEQNQLRALLSLEWSPDLNGAAGARRRAAAARAAAEAARLAAVRQATRATAVRLYVTWREGLARAAAEEAGVAALAGSLRLASRRRGAGLVSGLEPAAAEASRAAAAARIPAARQAAQTARLALEALLGISAGKLRSAAAPDLPSADPRGILLAPVEVLARRPDLRAAEMELAATGAAAEAARRDFWPTVSLGAAFGLQGANPEAPFTASGVVGSLTGGLLAPVFSFGRLEAARDGADARRRQAAIRYRQAATEALSEVETALMTIREVQARRANLAAAMAAARRRTALTDSRYRAGLSANSTCLSPARPKRG